MIHAEKFYFTRYSEINPIYKVMIYNDIWKALAVLVFEYPDFKTWYRGLFNWDYTLKSDRDILLCCYNQEIAGIAILKNSRMEKKICTLRVGTKYRNNGIGKKLIEKSFALLETERPLITVRKAKNSEFMPLFRYYGFDLEQDIRGYYRIFSSEMVYNGNLPPKDIGQYTDIWACGLATIIDEMGILIYENNFYWRGSWSRKNYYCAKVES